MEHSPNPFFITDYHDLTEELRAKADDLMDKYFKAKLPNSLFQTHYDLGQKTPFPPAYWRLYLKNNEHFITSETAAIAEAQARKALNSLGQGASSQEVTAIKALLEKSKLINDAQKQQQTVLLTYLPTKGQQTEADLLRRFIQEINTLIEQDRYEPSYHTEEWFKMKEMYELDK